MENIRERDSTPRVTCQVLQVLRSIGLPEAPNRTQRVAISRSNTVPWEPHVFCINPCFTAFMAVFVLSILYLFGCLHNIEHLVQGKLELSQLTGWASSDKYAAF